MGSKLKAIGRCQRKGFYMVAFYYQKDGDGTDLTMPTWEIPARDWDHMQATVRAFNGDEDL